MTRRAAGLLSLFGSFVWVTGCLAEGGVGLKAPAASFQEEVAERVNAERAVCTGSGCPLPPLKLVPVLSEVADRHSRAMARDDFFSHCDFPTGLHLPDRLRRAGYGYSAAAENLAGGAGSPAAAMAQWMQSPPHRFHLLDPEYRELGVGYFRQDDDLGNVDRDTNDDCDCRDRGETCRGEALTHYWTQVFGRRDGVYPLVIAGERQATASAEVEVYVYAPPGAAQMRLRNDGGRWSAWQPFASRFSWTLVAGDGQRSVFSEVVAGGAIHRACDRIWLTGTGPGAKFSEPVACEDDGTFRADEP